MKERGREEGGRGKGEREGGGGKDEGGRAKEEEVRRARKEGGNGGESKTNALHTPTDHTYRHMYMGVYIHDEKS